SLGDADVAAETENDDARRGLENIVQIVRDQHDREAVVRETLDEVEHLPCLGHAERSRRLVILDEPTAALGVAHDRESTRMNSRYVANSFALLCSNDEILMDNMQASDM